MEQAQLKQVLEGILFVYGQPMPIKRIQAVIPEADMKTVREAVRELNAEYESTNRAFQIQEIAGGFQFVTRQSLAPWVKRALESPRPDSVSVASMETLAIIAYRQPITKAEIEAIRGVDVGGGLDTLLEKQFIRTAGRKESPGRPFLYGTTNDFLRHFGLKSLEALPEFKLPEISEQTEAPPEREPVAVQSAAGVLQAPEDKQKQPATEEKNPESEKGKESSAA